MQRIFYASSVYDKLRVARSGITGMGLFAGCVIPARAKIGEFEGEMITIREARRRATGRRVVAIIELSAKAIDATHTGRGFRYINHCCQPNTFTRLTSERAEFYALRRIRAGEELTVDYGLSHHDGHLRCRCGSARCRGWI
ncbi:MAG: SET domain-containing protein-lysine N-methyltransferase [Gammaproteobacteria bacterium]